MTPGSMKEEDDRGGPSKAEIASVIASVAVTLALFAYVAFKAIAAPAGPHLETEAVRVEPEGDRVAVHVLLRNTGSIGVRSATVEIPCDDPPPSVDFQNVPAGGQRRGVIYCPGDAQTFRPEISTWIAE